MRYVLACALALAAVLSPSVADAQSCSGGGNGGGGGSSGSSGGSGGSGGSDGIDDTVEVEVCRDTTEITGIEECSRFGRGWDASGWPALSFALTFSARRVLVDELSFSGSTTHDDNPYRFVLREGDLPRAGAVGPSFGLRGVGFLTRGAYAGLELGAGVGPLSGPSLDTGDLVLTPTTATLLTGGGVGGLSVPLGAFALRAEVAVGVRALAVHLETRRGTCVTTTSVWSTGLWLEPRIGLDWFVTPWLTLGAFGGGEPLHGVAAWHGGLSVGVHTRSHDAQ